MAFSLDEILKRVRGGLQAAGNFVSRDIQRAPAVQAINQIRQAPQVQQIQNKAMNTRFIPGQVNTLDQVFRNVRQDPAKYLLSSSLAQGRLSTRNRFVDENIAKPAGQAVNSLVNMSSLGFVNLPGKRAETLPEKIGSGVGTVAGFINPVGVAPKVLGPIGLLGEKAVGRIAPKALSKAPKLAQSVVKAVGSEAAQSGAYVGAKKLTGQEADFQGDILAGLGLRGGFGLAAKGLKGYSPNAFDVHPDDIAVMDDFIKRVRGGGAKSALGKAGKDAQRLADHYIGEKAKDLTNERLATVFESLIKKNQGEPTKFPALGIVGKNDVSQPQRIDEILSNRKGKGNLPLQRSSQPPIQSQQIPEIGSSGPKSPSSSGNGSSGRSIAQVPNSENPYFNTNKLKVSPQAKQQVNQVIQEVKSDIEKVVGKKLSNEEVIKTANNSAKVLNKVVDRAQTADFEARLLRTRQKLAAAAESGVVDREYIDNLMAVKSHATDIARKLQSFSIGADPNLVTSKDAILDAVLKVEKDSDKVIKAAEGVDFNDLNQATDFYRQFIKPTTREWVDLIRYNSMLSSPNTHITNTFSNLVNSGVVAPIEKTLTGTLDFLGSQITGKPQKQFAGEGYQYAKGYIQNVHNAAHALARVMKGQAVTGNLDVRQIPLSTTSRVQNLNLPTRLLEGMDQFFTALTKGGEEAALKYRKGKGVNVGQIETQAIDNAKYRLFRSELHNERQGTLLNSIDDFTGLVQKARNSDNVITSTIAKFTLPFVQTPMNILKQGVEYSPLGLATLKGAPNKTEQLSKALLGSSAAAATAMLVASGRTTWAEPTDASKRAAFRSAGLQPYSIKIGNKWVSFAKVPPAIGFPIAFVSALHDAQENRTLDQNELDVILNATAKFGNFFADQSYVKNIGDLVAATKGSAENMTRFVSNYPQQLVPYRALLGWMARLIDPYQRKVDTDAGFLERQVQELFRQIPGLSMTVPARLDKTEQPIPNQNKEINALSPLRVTTERPEQKEYFDLLKEKALNTKNTNILKDKIKKGEDVTLPQVGATEISSTGNTEADKLRAKMKEDVIKERVKMSGKSEKLPNGDIIYKDEDKVKTLKLSVDEKKGEGIEAFDVKNKKNEVAREVWGSKLSKEDKDYAFKKLGVDKEDVRYDYLSSSKFDSKERANYIASKDLDQSTLYERLLTGRIESISGKMFVTNGVLDELADQGLISKADAKALKKVKLDKKGQPLAGSGGFGKGKGGTGKKQRKALANYFKDRSTSLSKLFASNIKNDRPSNASNLEKILKQRSPQNRGLKSIESILAQSEALTKKKRGGKTIQAVLGG